MSATISIGTQYTNRKGQLCTVADVWTTFNSKGELVQTRYVVTHQFMGQIVAERDVMEITIRKAMVVA